MLDKKLGSEINAQINRELESEYIYLAMVPFFAEKSLDGFANFFMMQAQEERFHAMKLFDYLHSRGGKAKLEAMEKPQSDYASIMEVFQAGLEHEKYITKSINDLLDLATEQNDKPTMSFLQWYVDEQVEEEDMFQGIIDRLELVGDSGVGLLQFDQEFSQRVFTPPTESEE